MTETKKTATPYGDRILVIPEDKMSQTAGGIIIPDTVVQKPSKGVIKTVGEQCSFAKVGDQVLFSKETGIPITIDGEELLLMRESELMVKLSGV